MTATAAQPSAKYPPVRNYIGGVFVSPDTSSLDVLDPSSGRRLSQVPMSPPAQLDDAVRAAEGALAAWSAKPIKERVQVFYRYRTLLERDVAGLAALISEEHGKTRVGGRGRDRSRRSS